MTLAGLGTPEKPHPIQKAYVEEQVPQCGYCINGWIMTAAAFLDDNKKPTEAQIKDALSGLKCRCGTHVGILRAVKRAADDDGLREATMTKMEKPRIFSRRALLKAGGALVVSIGTPIALDTVLGDRRGVRAGRASRRSRPISSPPTSRSTPTARSPPIFGKMDMGQGLFVAIGQMVAEELDVPFKSRQSRSWATRRPA